LVLAGVLFVLDTTFFFSQQQYGNHYWMMSKHLISIAVGAVVMFALSRFRSDRLERLSKPVLLLAAGLLVLPLIPGIGSCSKGACRWVPLGPVNLQPSEFAKAAFVIYAAAALTRKSDRLGNWRYGLAPTLMVMCVLGGFLLLEPDFGTAVIVGSVGAAMMFIAGVPFLHVAGLGAALAGSAGVLVLVEPYRVARFLGFWNPWNDPTGAGYQLLQALRAFGSGLMFGRGIGASRQNAGWLPEAHTDFVFSVIGEETGLIGAALIVLCFAVFAYRGFRVAHRHPEMFGQMLAAGITLVIVAQATFNICVTLGLLPTKGMVLPFLSYGGSSMVVTLASVGILMSLSRELRER
jgi:cell division protein FtsW